MSELISEFGGEGFRFLNPSQVSMIDSDDNEILCKCGKPAGSAALGRDSYVAWCSDCSLLHKDPKPMTFKKPSKDQGWINGGNL